MVIKTSLLSISILFPFLFFWQNTPSPEKNTFDSTNLSFFDTAHFCAQHLAQENLWQKKPNQLIRHLEFEKRLLEFLKKNSGNIVTEKADYTIPVVVHIIHNNGPENISDATVIQGIQYLNDAYENIGYYDQGTGVNTGFAFCLARRDPDGNATTGITRNISILTDMVLEDDDLTVKDLSRWDPTEYLNIWLVNSITSAAAGPGVAGYAYFPTSHGAPEDGIMMEAEWFGSDPGSSSVIVHEAGHYLGVYHTFEGGCTNSDCLVDGDRVCDTPPDNSTAAVPCNGTMNSCSTDADSGFPTDQNDMFWNYMDYGDWDCYSAFTQGQTDRMVFTIENDRKSLLDSKGCLDPCTSPLTASFTASATTLDVGGTINFLNNSINATSAIWKIDGVIFSNNINADYTFNQVGFFEICLEIGNNDVNCSDKFCLKIEITCPVNAEFITDNFYPAPNHPVNYTNQSQNANEYEWQINGTAESTGVDFNWSFQNEGIYDVCLIANNGLCENEFCLPVFVTLDTTLQGECDTTFLKTYGSNNEDEFGYALTNAPDGGFFLGGGKGIEAMISKLDGEGNLEWTRKFDPTGDASDFIWEIKLDSDDNMIGIGQTRELTGNVEAFAFKYDWQNDNFIWINEIDIVDPALEGYFSIIEKAPGGNYNIFGQSGFLTNTNGLMMEVNRNSGGSIWEREFSLNGFELFHQTILYNGAYYSTGRYRTAGNQIRPGITRKDLNGNEIWTKIHLVAPSTNNPTRLVGKDIIADNGLVVLGSGSPTGGTASTDIFLYRTNDSGDLEWEKSFDIPIANQIEATQLMNLPDGYLCLGYYSLNSGGSDIFLFKTNKQGGLEWARSYDGIYANEVDEAYDMLYQNGQIFFTGKTTDGPDEDVFLARLGVDGNPSAQDSCNFFSVLEIVETDWSAPLWEQVNLTETNSNYGFFPGTETTQSFFLEESIICFAPCNDSCDFRPDAQFVSANAFCMGDSMMVELNLCNFGNFILPENTPIIFYDNDPTSVAANILHTDFTTKKIKRDSCLFFQILMPTAINQEIYLMINDSGTTPTPFNLSNEDDFPNSGITECNFTNNIGSFKIDFSPPMLDLGPDITACENGVVELDAGPGFYKYRWQNGEDEQTFTAFFPGIYSVVTTDSCGGMQNDEVTITIDPATIIDLGNDTLVCEGDPLIISLNGFDKYEWFPKNIFGCDTCSTVEMFPTPDDTLLVIVVASTNSGCYSLDTILVGATLPIFTFDTIYFCPGDTLLLFDEIITEEGIYSGVFPGAEGCDSTHTVSVEAVANLILALPDDLTIELGDSIQINPITNGQNLIWEWSPSYGLSCVDCEHPYARPFETTSYKLVITDENGCDARDDILLSIIKNRGIYIPNAFSPNGDGINDVFHIYSRPNVSQVLEFKVFDRWGELIFEDANFLPNDPVHGWDGTFKGKIMNPAVFTYMARVEFVDGYVQLFSGDVVLAR